MTEIKIVALGDGGVGKTAITIMYVAKHFVETYDPTIEDTYRKQTMIDGHPVLLDVLDTAGQEEFSALRDSWMRYGKCYLLIFDITSRSSFEQLSSFQEKLLRIHDVDTTDNLSLVMVGNKADLQDQREVSVEECEQLAACWNVPYVEVSAKHAQGVDEAFEIVAKHHLKRHHAHLYNEKKDGKKTASKSKQCNIL
jgi:GTPase KRas